MACRDERIGIARIDLERPVSIGVRFAKNRFAIAPSAEAGIGSSASAFSRQNRADFTFTLVSWR
jgi:hypothetical protein